MADKKLDIIGKIYNGIIEGIASGKDLVAAQGSARAGKSFNIMIFLIQCCMNPKLVNNLMYVNYQKRERLDRWSARGDKDNIHVSVVRLALPSIKRSIYQDFREIMYNMGIYDPKCMNMTEMTYTFPNGSKMEFFATADNEQKVRGSKRDILFVNEANEIGEWEFSQLRMRTEDFSIVDFNPSFTEEHWLFGKLHEDRTHYFISTFLDNPFLSESIKDEIMSYKYTNPALWQIFGMGNFAIVEGLVFPKENWDICKFTEIPIDVKVQRIGIDVGFSGKGDPTAVVRCWFANINGVNHMWLHLVVYEKGLTEKQLAFRLKPYNDIPKFIDSANPLYIQNLQDNGVFNIQPVKKYANSIVDGLTKMMGYHIHITNSSVELIKEFQNYCWMKDRHEQYTNTPIDKWNHGIDAARYAAMQDRSARFGDGRKRHTKSQIGLTF